MTCKKQLQEWKHALTKLQESSSKDLDIGKNLFARLKLSYDALPDKEEKDCFLHCCLYPEDKKMCKEDLIHYWIGEGVLPFDGSFKDTLNRGYDIIGKLLAACLLEKDDDSYVRMHDVIRDMGLWVASKIKLTFFVNRGSQLTKAQINDKWREAHGLYVLKGDELPEQPLCLNLSTLIFANHQGIKISNGFFKSMCKIRVLHLVHIQFLDLPTAIGQLLELRYLCIKQTNLETLPTEIGNLSKLEVLLLNDNFYLGELPKTIDQLVELRRITVDCPKAAFLVRLINLRKLEILKLEILQCSDFYYQDYDSTDLIVSLKELTHALRHLRMWSWPKITSRDELLLALQNMHKLSKLELGMYPLKEFLVPSSSCLHSLEELAFRFNPKLEKIHVDSMELHNLSKLVIHECRSLEYIFGLHNLLGLVELTIMHCDAMKEVIREDEEVKGHICFPNLKVMNLMSLKQLKIIGGDSVLFPSITHFTVLNCPKLEKLPRGLMNEKKTLDGVVIYCSREWWELDKLLRQDDDFKSFILSRNLF